MSKYFYRFPFGKNSDGTPRINSQMSHEEYESYKAEIAQISNELKVGIVNCAKSNSIRSVLEPVCVDLNKLDLVRQTASCFKSIPYPVPSEPTRTVASHGAFQIIVHNVLEYFGKEVSIEELTRIANFGMWQHDPNGTWRHFVDVVCQAYGLDTVRLGDWSRIYDAIKQGNLILSLIDHKMFPAGHGNSLVLVTGIENGEVIFYHPRFGDHLLRCGIAHFMLNTKVLWGIAD